MAVVLGCRRGSRGQEAAEVTVLWQPPGAFLLGLDAGCGDRQGYEGVSSRGRHTQGSSAAGGP